MSKRYPVSFYLGTPEERERRKERLDRLARELGVSQSELIQKIADGEYIVIRSSNSSKDSRDTQQAAS